MLAQVRKSTGAADTAKEQRKVRARETRDREAAEAEFRRSARSAGRAAYAAGQGSAPYDARATGGLAVNAREVR